MNTQIKPVRLAGTAIAAVLALSVTPALAQDAAAVVQPVEPAPAQPAAASPAIVLPPVATNAPAPEAPAPTTAAPTVEEPAAAQSAPVATRSQPTPRAAASRQARSAEPAAAVAPIAAPAPSAAAEVPLSPAELDEPQTDVAPVAAVAENEGADDTAILAIGGALAALGLAGVGLVGLNRRRRRSAAPADADYDQDRIVPTGEATTDPMVARDPVPSRPAAQPIATPRPAYATSGAPTIVTSPRSAFAGAASAPLFGTTPVVGERKAFVEPRVAGPAAFPSRLNREALLDRMVAAEPDANNPFTSGKARRRRARLMLQSLDHDRWEDAELAPGFDWREMAKAAEQREREPVTV